MGRTMGRDLTREVDAALLDMDVRNPARFANMMAPGFERAESFSVGHATAPTSPSAV